MGWFIASQEGLAEWMNGKPKIFILAELLKNAWDENSTRVTIDLTYTGKTATLVVEDDSPDGWQSLDSAFTLFRPSYKKGDPTKRGRFEAGDKMAFSVCREVIVETMEGKVHFLPKGERQNHPRIKRERGTKVTCIIPMKKAEYEGICNTIHTFIPPEHIETMFNGSPISHRKPFCEFQETLPTVQGPNLSPTRRITKVQVYHPEVGKPAGLYEMGVRILDTEDKYIINVDQKLPLNLEQNNVPAAYRKAIRVSVANHVLDDLEPDDMTEDWVQEATGDKRAAKELTEKFLDSTQGKDRVAFDPNNPDSVDTARGAGYNIVPSRGLTKGQRANAKKHDLLRPAGQVFPTHDGTVPGKMVPESEWTQAQKVVARYSKEVAKALWGIHLKVQMIESPKATTVADYTHAPTSLLRYNLAHGSLPSFDQMLRATTEREFYDAVEPIDDLLIHELGHQKGKEHDLEYRSAITTLAAKFKRLAMEHPELLRKEYVRRSL